MIELHRDTFGTAIELSQAENKILIVDIWAPWCAPCLSLAPVIEALAEKYKDNIKLAKINLDDGNKIFVAELKVRSIPTLLFYKQGKLEKFITGNRSESDLEEIIKELIGIKE